MEMYPRIILSHLDKYLINRYLTSEIYQEILSVNLPKNLYSNKNSIEPFCNNDTTLVIVAHSIPKEYKVRQAIRSSWGQWTRSRKDKRPDHLSTRSNNIELYFLIGKDPKLKEKEWDIINKEAYIFKDIIYDPSIIDHYNNLTLKTVKMLRWTYFNCKSARYLFKSDTDIFLNIPLLIKSLTTLKNNDEPFIAGNAINYAQPMRQKGHKWYISEEDYAGLYPKYVNGPGYIISKRALEEMILQLDTYKEKYIIFEDVFIGILAKLSSISIVDLPDFLTTSSNYDHVCLPHQHPIIHKVDPTRLVTNLYLVKELWSLCNNLNYVNFMSINNLTEAFDLTILEK